MASPLTYSDGALILMGDDNAEFVTLAKAVLEHMAANDGPGGLYTSNVGNADFSLIGTFTDTSYAGNIGEGNATILTTSYEIFQDLTTPTGDDPPLPITYNDNTSPIQVMTESQLDDLANSILSWGLLNDGPHSFILQTTAPSDGGTWTSLGTLTDVYANSISTPVQTNKNLYKKLSSGAFTLNRPLKSNGLGELIEFSDTEVNNIAKKVRERIVNTGIGTYLFQASTPSPGTWVAKGNITNTITTTSAFNYTGDYSGERSYDSIQPDSATYVTNYVASYSAPIAYTGSYLQSYSSPVVFVGSYEANYSSPAIYTGIREQVFLGPGFTEYSGGTYTGAASFGERDFALFIGIQPDSTGQGIFYQSYDPNSSSNLYASPTTGTVYEGPAIYVGVITTGYQTDFPFSSEEGSWNRSIYTINDYEGTSLYTGEYYIGGLRVERYYSVKTFLGVYISGPITGALYLYTGSTATNYLGWAEFATQYYVSDSNTDFYLGPGENFYTGRDLQDYLGPHYNVTYSGAGVNIYVFAATYTATVNFLEFSEFTTGFAGPGSPVFRERGDEGLYTGTVDYELTDLIWAGFTSFYVSSYNDLTPSIPGSTYLNYYTKVSATILSTYFLGTQIYSGLGASVASPGGVYYLSVLTPDIYTGIDNVYTADYSGLRDLPFAGFAVFNTPVLESYTTYTTFLGEVNQFFTGFLAYATEYVAGYLGAGPVNYTGDIVDEEVYSGVLIEDTPIDISTITLWRRVA